MVSKFIISIFVVLSLLVSSCSNATVKPRIINLTGKNTIIFNQEIDPVSVDNAIKGLIGARTMLPENETLIVILVSGGGEYSRGKVILSLISKLPNIQIYCKYCASMAGAIFVGSGVKRLVTAKSVLLMHEMFYPHFTAQMAMNAAYAKSLIEDSDEFNKEFYKRVPMTKEAYEKKILNTEWTLYGEEIIKNNLADEMVEFNCDIYVKTLAPDTCSKEVKK